MMIHVVARSNALQGGYFRSIPNWLHGGVALLCCLLVGGLFRASRIFRYYTFTVEAIALAIALVSFLFFSGAHLGAAGAL